MKQICTNKQCKKEIDVDDNQKSLFIQCEFCNMFNVNKNTNIKMKQNEKTKN